MNRNRFKEFTDDELYMLKRQAIEASVHIMMSGRYEKDLQKLHNNLINEILIEYKRRNEE